MTKVFPYLTSRQLVWMIAILTPVILVACGGGASGSDSQFPIAVTDQRVTVGEQVYAVNCSQCHGQIGSSPALPGSPSHAEDGHTWHHADRHLFQWILDRPPLAQLMPAFRGTLSDEEVSSVIAYIKSNWPSDIRERQNDLSRLIEQQLIEDALR